MLRWLEMLGLDPDQVGDRLVLTPACGLAGASPAWAQTLTRTAARGRDPACLGDAAAAADLQRGGGSDPGVHDLRAVGGQLLVLDVEEDPGDERTPRASGRAEQERVGRALGEDLVLAIA